MKKRVLILAMAAFMVTASSDYTISIVHAEEHQNFRSRHLHRRLWM